VTENCRRQDGVPLPQEQARRPLGIHVHAGRLPAQPPRPIR
jgi:hypothetical protein